MKAKHSHQWVLGKGFKVCDKCAKVEIGEKKSTKQHKSEWWKHSLTNSKPPLFGKAVLQIKNGSVMVFFLKPIIP